MAGLLHNVRMQIQSQRSVNPNPKRQRRHGPAPDGLWTVVLAAGGSTRLGRPKQLLRLHGTTLLTRATRLAGQITPARVVIVLGADRLRLLRHLRRTAPALPVVVNPRWDTGMAGSLARGLRQLPGQATAILVLLSDQPRITAGDIGRLVTRWRRRPGLPAAAEYAGRAGVPAIIPARYFAELRCAHGDAGARDLLRRTTGLSRVAIPAAAFDVDTPADAASLR